MQRRHIVKSKRASRLDLARVCYRNLRVSCLLLFLSIFSFVVVPYLIMDANAANNVAAAATWTPVSLTLATSDVAFGDITPSVDDGTNNFGTMVVTRKNVGITSNGKAVKVYLSTNDDDSNDLVHETATGVKIPAIGDGTTTGIWTNPTSFSGKGWGYAVPDKTESGSTIFSTSFDTDAEFASYFGINVNALTSQLEYGDGGYNGKTWAAVPKLGNEQLIYSMTTTEANGFTDDAVRNNFDIYYAVVADESLISGTYSNQVVYTAIGSMDSLDNVSYNIGVENQNSNGVNADAKRFANNGNRLKLTFDLAASPSNLIEYGDLEIYLVPHATIAAANYSLTNAITAGKANYPKCTIASSADFTITTDGSAGATVYCTIGNSTNGAAPTIADSTTTNVTDGFYDVWIHIEDYGINYFSKYQVSGVNVASVIFAGLQSKDASGAVVTSMQQMTAQVCNLTNKWAGYDGSNYHTGSDAVVKDYNGATLTNVYDSSNTLVSSVTGYSDSNKLGVGTFALADARDAKTYLVRRLADGNCWMVQNLDYDLTVQANRSLSPATSNVSSARTLSSKTLTSEIKSSCSYQYQPYNVAGSNCLWGSLTSDGTDTIAVANNSRAAFARSYSNTINGANNNSFSDDQFRYIPTHQINGTYDQYGTSEDGVSPATAMTAGFTPTATANSGNAVGYYGNMYIGTYYNWYAATAETGTWATGASGAQNASSSICPAGWQLPVNGQENDKSWGKLIMTSYKLINTQGDQNAHPEYNDFNSSTEPSKRMHELPLSIPFSGNYGWNDGKLYSRGYDGNFWSSTAYASTSSHRLYFHATYVYPQNGNHKAYGFTVRCVAQ